MASFGRLSHCVTGVAAVLAALLLMPVAPAGAQTITQFSTVVQASQGNGWSPHPSQTAGGSERFVEGPTDPPSGTGSLEMDVAATSDRALVFTVPKAGTGPPPPGEISSFVPTPWANLSGSYSTFTPSAAVDKSSTVPTLRIVGYQQFNDANPLLSQGYTTLSFEPVRQPTAVETAVWQTWTLGPTSLVIQSNQTDGQCNSVAPCTLAQFAALYPQGAWGPVDLGLGSGVTGGTTSFVDDLHISDGTTTFTYDFEVPKPDDSTATIAAGPPTPTGGTVNVTLHASALSALGDTVFGVVIQTPTGADVHPVSVPAGQTVTVSFAVPFGTSEVTVQGHGATEAEAPVSFALPTTTTESPTTSSPVSSSTGTETSTGATEAATLAATGDAPGWTIGVALLSLIVGVCLTRWGRHRVSVCRWGSH
jgi:hypothetical protein